MKRHIKSSYDPFASALGYSDEEQKKIYTWVAMLQQQAAENLPKVDMEINSFRIDRDSGLLKLTGDMTYDDDNRWLDIIVPADGEFEDCVFAYLSQVKQAYGSDLFEGTGLEHLVSVLKEGYTHEEIHPIIYQ